MSYTLYLSHVFVMQLANMMFKSLGINITSWPIRYSLILIVSSVLVAAIAYRFLERKLSGDFLTALERLFGAREDQFRLASTQASSADR